MLHEISFQQEMCRFARFPRKQHGNNYVVMEIVRNSISMVLVARQLRICRSLEIAGAFDAKHELFTNKQWIGDRQSKAASESDELHAELSLRLYLGLLIEPFWQAR